MIMFVESSPRTKTRSGNKLNNTNRRLTHARINPNAGVKWTGLPLM